MSSMRHLLLQWTRQRLAKAPSLAPALLQPPGLARGAPGAAGAGGGPHPSQAARLTTAAQSGGAGTLTPLEEGAQAAVCREVVLEGLSDEAAEQLAEVLLEEGASAVSITEHRPEGSAEQELYGSESPLWDHCSLAVTFPLEADVGAAMAAAGRLLGVPGELPHKVRDVPAEDWLEVVKAAFKPLRIVGSLWIVPAWSPVPEGASPAIRLEPGLAFGTGEHPTTRLCLRWLHSLALEGQRVLDYGTGSGVLAIGVLLLGAARACGTDTDELAVRAAQGNAALNGVSERLQLLRCSPSLEDGAAAPFQGEAFSACVANILQGPLLDLQPRLAAYVEPGGLIGLSGILASQVPAVKQAYGAAFEAFEVHTEDGWALLVGRKR